MRHLLFALLLSLVSTPALAAAVVENLYVATVPVKDHGQSALQAGMSAAMAEVLVKVSGRSQVVSAAAMQSLLDAPRDYVQQYQYQRDPEAGLQLQVEFAAQLLNQALTEARLPLWSSTRPAVLVWIAVNDTAGRRFATAEADPELLEQVTAAFARRGVPIVLPLLDLEDTLAIAPEQVWDFDYQAISNAAQRYAVTNVLVGQLHQLPDDRWMGEWQYLWGDGSYSVSDYGVASAAMARVGADLSAEKMAQRYAVEAVAEQTDDVRVQVQGLTSYADYRRALDYLAETELVETVQVDFVVDELVVFRVQAPLQLEQLSRLIELRGRMLLPAAIDPLPEDAEPATLVYQWLP